MEKEFIPNFKRSSDSVHKDVLKLKKLEAISEGWYKGQLIHLLEKTAGKTIIDGIECYNTNILINGSTAYSDNSEYAKNIRKLLKLLGLSDSNFASINENWNSGQVDSIFLNFNKIENLDREYTLEDFKYVYTELKKLISEVEKIELIQSDKTYADTETNRIAVESSVIHSGTAWVIDDSYYEDSEEQRNFSLSQTMQYSEMKLYDILNNEITSNYTENLLLALKTIVIVSGKQFAELVSVEKISETIYYPNSEETRYYVETKETYITNLNSNFTQDEYYRYKHGNIPVEIQEGEAYISYTINGILANHIWELFLHIDDFDNDKSNDLFYTSKRNGFLSSVDSTQRYIRVEGLRKSSVRKIARLIAETADFRFDIKKKKKKFLGIGGFIGSFLSGLFELILKAITFISNILYYIPSFREVTQIIAWIFSGKWSNDRKRLTQVSNRILLAVISILIIIYTGGSGVQIAISLLTSAYGLYTGLKSYDDLVESMKKKIENDKSITDNELYEKLLDFSKDENSTKEDLMYKPFKQINNQYKNNFGKGGEYEIKYSI